MLRIIAFSIVAGTLSAQDASTTLWYDQPAGRFYESAPLGNGRLGAMVFGDVGVERLQINDDTLWSGGPGNWDTPGAKAARGRGAQR